MSVTTVAGSFITLNTINSDHYVDGSIDLVHIGANQIDGTKIALGSDAQGDIMYYDGTNWVRLGFGTSGHFLKTQGTGANPVWAAAGGTTYTTGSTNVHVVNDATTGVTLNDDYKFSMTMPSSGEGFFFKCADQGTEHAALFFAEYSTQVTKIAGGSKWETIDAGQTGSSGDGKFYVVKDFNARAIWIYNREGNNRVITVHGMGRLASVTAQAAI